MEKKYGIWNVFQKCFQFGISEKTPELAMARLHQLIGKDAYKIRFEPRETKVTKDDTCR